MLIYAIRVIQVNLLFNVTHCSDLIAEHTHKVALVLSFFETKDALYVCADGTELFRLFLSLGLDLLVKLIIHYLFVVV